MVVCPRSHVVASACAIARACPLYSRKTPASTANFAVTAFFVLTDVDGIVGGDLRECIFFFSFLFLVCFIRPDPRVLSIGAQASSEGTGFPFDHIIRAHLLSLLSRACTWCGLFGHSGLTAMMSVPLRDRSRAITSSPKRCTSCRRTHRIFFVGWGRDSSLNDSLFIRMRDSKSVTWLYLRHSCITYGWTQRNAHSQQDCAGLIVAMFLFLFCSQGFRVCKSRYLGGERPQCG